MALNRLEMHTLNHIKSYQQFSLALMFLSAVVFLYKLYEIFSSPPDVSEALLNNALLGASVTLFCCGIIIFHLIRIIKKSGICS